jgi:hypothetical protein
MTSKQSSNGNQGPNALVEKYKVGPGRPPKEHQFKPGQSGNPKGAKRKPPSLLPDLKRSAGCRTLNARIVVRIHEGEPMQEKTPV